MKIERIITFLVICLILTNTCKKSTKSQNEVNIQRINLDTLMKIKDYPYRNIFTNYNITFIQNSPTYLVGNINKIIFDKSTYAILNNNYQYAIISFSAKGYPLERIGQLGRGPEELITPIDFSIDKMGNYHILDAETKTVKQFSSKGKYISSTKLNFYTNQFTEFNSNYYFLVSAPGSEKYQSNYYIFKTNDRGEIIDKYLPYPHCNKGFRQNYQVGNGIFSKDNDNLNITLPFSDTIFKVDKNNVTPHLILETKNTFSKEEMGIINQRNFIPHLIESERLKDICNYLENERWIYVKFSINRIPHRLIIDKKLKKKIYFGFPNDNITGLYPEFFCITDSSLIGFVSPSSLKRRFNSRSKHEILSNTMLSEADYDSIMNIDESINPVIIEYLLSK